MRLERMLSRRQTTGGDVLLYGCRPHRVSDYKAIAHRCYYLCESSTNNLVLETSEHDSSTFGSEFVALQIAIEMIEGSRCKLRMSSVAIDGPGSVFCDNDAFVLNSSLPESILKKKHAAIIGEAIAAGVIRIAKEDTKTNVADLLTKCLPGPTLREHAARVLG